MKSYQKRTVSQESASSIIEGATAKAKELGVAAVIAVVDESAVLKAFYRMDGTLLLPVQVAQAKARSAALLSVDNGVMFDALEADPEMRSGLIAQPGVTLMGGGLVLRDGDEIVGAVGVSGGSTEQDITIATAGRDAAGL
ncbi:MAG: Cob(I)alamin adenosyltransferase [Subtercola sp.]|nr:Cob(I)alamin adenosyltransferase [Subtercola sp.]